MIVPIDSSDASAILRLDVEPVGHVPCQLGGTSYNAPPWNCSVRRVVVVEIDRFQDGLAECLIIPATSPVIDMSIMFMINITTVTTYPLSISKY